MRSERDILRAGEGGREEGGAGGGGRGARITERESRHGLGCFKVSVDVLLVIFKGLKKCPVTITLTRAHVPERERGRDRQTDRQRQRQRGRERELLMCLLRSLSFGGCCHVYTSVR